MWTVYGPCLFNPEVHGPRVILKSLPITGKGSFDSVSLIRWKGQVWTTPGFVPISTTTVSGLDKGPTTEWNRELPPVDTDVTVERSVYECKTDNTLGVL